MKIFQEMKKKSTKRSAERGMTLVEIMVVVIIIGLVTSFVGVQVFGRLKEARIRTAQTQIHSIGEALDLYKLSLHQYPTTGEGLVALTGSKDGTPPYMKSVPKDPWGKDYVYISPGVQNTDGYDLCSYGPDGEQSGQPSICNYEIGSAE